MAKKIILLGPPGVGKGTVADKLTKKLNLPHIATGDMLRDNTEKKTPLGIKAKSFMDKGLLVPDEVVIEMVRQRLKQDDCKDGFVLDGFPRTINQAEKIDDLNFDEVINLQATDDIIIKRLNNRRVCSKCGSIFHLDYIKPKQEGICDKCNGKLIQREDDKDEAIKERLKVYRSLTEPLISYFKNKGILVEVDGSKTPKEVFESVVRVVSWVYAQHFLNEFSYIKKRNF